MRTSIGKWYAKLSLRTKATGISLLITSGSLIAVATTGILQIHRQMASEQRRSAESVAMGFARAAALPLAAGDRPALTRLANSFLLDGNVLFIAVYRNGAPANAPLACAVRDARALNDYFRRQVDGARCVLAEKDVDESEAGGDELLRVTGNDANRSGRAVGRVVVGLSTSGARVALEGQIRATVVVTAVSAGIGSLILFVTLGMWLKRLDRLSAASGAISRGDFDAAAVAVAVGEGKDDEIGRLGQSFDAMRHALQERDGRLRDFTETLQDQVKQRTAQLENAVAAAEQASLAKSLFLANMSHELRTPLNGVIGMVDLLLKTRPDATQHRYCNVAKASAHSLLELINDILDFSKIEAGRLDLEDADFDLHEVLDQVTAVLEPRAVEKRLELVAHVDPGVPRHVTGDAVRLRQVLMNLLSNAVKFTAKGSVVARVELVEETETHASIRFAVRDSGIGIPADRLDRLFQSFSQVDASTTRKFGGTGLGLAISQRIVEMMGGKIVVDSVQGQGSTFSFVAKLMKCAAPSGMPTRAAEDEPPVEQALAGVRVLLAEDNEVNRLLACELLELAGGHCDVAVNGREAVEAALREAYDAILMDCQMPELDGFEATRHIRAAEAGGGRRRVIIALTANAIKGDRERCLEAGMDGYVTKPIDPEELFRTIRSLVKHDAPAAAPVLKSQVLACVPVNVDELRRRCLGNRKVASKALVKFDESLDGYVRAVSDGIDRKDAASLMAAAHKVKGAAGNVSAEGVRRVAATLEELARTDSLGGAEDALRTLRDEVEQVKGFLASALASLQVPVDA